MTIISRPERSRTDHGEAHFHVSTTVTSLQSFMKCSKCVVLCIWR